MSSSSVALNELLDLSSTVRTTSYWSHSNAYSKSGHSVTFRCWMTIHVASTAFFKKVASLKLFGIFSLRLSLFCVKFRKFVDNSYPHISTDFCRFILIFHQMALIFQRVPFVFTLTSFEYSSIKLTQKDLTEVKIFQKVFGVGTSFWNTLYLWSRRSQMRVLYAMMLSICLSVRSFVRSYVACVLWNLLSHSLGGSTWRRASQSAATSEIVIL